MNAPSGALQQTGARWDPQPGSMDAIVLAGGINRIALYEGYEPGYKALLPYAGTPSIRFTLEALRGSQYVRDVCVVGSQETLAEAIGDSTITFAPEGEGLLGSVVSGLEFFRDRQAVLVATADLPLVTAAIIDEFVEHSAAAPTEFGANAYLAAIPKEAFTGAFASVRKDMSPFRGGTLCHGNLAVVEPRLLANAAATERLNTMYAARKNALKSALALGVGVGLAYVVGVHFLHLLTARQMAHIASRRFQFGIVPVVVSRPELALDVDEPEDYRLVSELLRQRPQTT